MLQKIFISNKCSFFQLSIQQSIMLPQKIVVSTIIEIFQEQQISVSELFRKDCVTLKT